MIRCQKSIRACRLKITRADRCGRPLDDTEAMSRVIAGFVSLSLAPEIDGGTEILERGSDDRICLYSPARPVLKKLVATLTVCGVVFPIHEMLLGLLPLIDEAGTDTVGGALPDQLGSGRCEESNINNAIIEVYTEDVSDDACDEDQPYTVWLLPMTTNWQIDGNIDFVNNASTKINVKGDVLRNRNFAATGTVDDPANPGTPIPNWSPAQVAVIQGAGPIAFKSTHEIPAETPECQYEPAA